MAANYYLFWLWIFIILNCHLLVKLKCMIEISELEAGSSSFFILFVLVNKLYVFYVSLNLPYKSLRESLF